MNIFAIFHINLCYSSIEEEQKTEVIKKCYWPLLNIIEKLKIPVAIEATGFSLEEIEKRDKTFIKKLKFLINKNYCEFIGSGYCQIIAPLVPAKVNYYNLQIGNQIYSKILNIKPKIALVNEQVFSTGIVKNYLRNDYETLILDWDNFINANKEVNKKNFYFPQKILDKKNEINVIWSSSVLFQNFQRYVHGEKSLNEYIKFLHTKKSNLKKSSICIYASDLETINYRTNRYFNEAKIQQNEWDRVEFLFKKLIKNKYKFIKPSDNLKIKNNFSSFKKIEFNNATFPSVTKKQDKYNIVRWAVSGRNNIKINTICWKIYTSFNKKKKKLTDWKKLCYFWSSDFRTHITYKRWKRYLKELYKFRKKNINSKNLGKVKNKSNNIVYKINEDKIFISNKRISLILNTKKGCSIEKFYDKTISKNSLFGLIPQGFFNNISYDVDFYSGHMVIEPLGAHKITDLTDTKIRTKFFSNKFIVYSSLKNDYINFTKQIIFDGINNKIGIKYSISLKKNIFGSIRVGFLTINSETFKNNLYYSTHCGGRDIEKFYLKNSNFDHGKSVSHLTTANQALGLTENIIHLGDKLKNIKVTVDRNYDAIVGMILFQKIKNKKLLRLFFSLKENDDTTKKVKKFRSESLIWISAH